MRPLYKAMDVPSPIAAGSGDKLFVDRFREKAVQIGATNWTAGDVAIEGSNDGGTTWSEIDNLSEPGFIYIPFAVNEIRVTLGAGIAADAIVAYLGALDGRSD